MVSLFTLVVHQDPMFQRVLCVLLAHLFPQLGFKHIREDKRAAFRLTLYQQQHVYVLEASAVGDWHCWADHKASDLAKIQLGVEHHSVELLLVVLDEHTHVDDLYFNGCHFETDESRHFLFYLLHRPFKHFLQRNCAQRVFSAERLSTLFFHHKIAAILVGIN